MEYAYIQNHPLSDEDRSELNQIMNGYDSPVVRRRAHAIILLFGDRRTFEDVAEIFHVHVNTPRNWAERWVCHGIDGLYDQPGRGAKPIFEPWEEEIILGYVEEEPRSLRSVAQKIEKYLGKKASIETLRGIVKKHGKTWKRERKNLKKQPPAENYEKGKADLKELKQMAADGEFSLVYFDASGFSLTPEIPYAWQNIGREGTIGIPTSKSKRINVLGFLNPATGQLKSHLKTGSIDSDLIIQVMDDYCETMAGPTVAVLDNASVHISRAVTEKLDEWDRLGLTLYFLPTYSPQLNPIEILWRKIKYEWMPISAYTDFDSLKSRLMDILFAYGEDYIINFQHSI
jgi:transposase